MEIKILVVSDTHAAYDVLDKVVEKEKEAIDCIIHSGDFANLQPDQKHLLEAQLEGLEVYENTIKILKKAGKPIVCVPGNHDSDRLFYHLTSQPFLLDNVYLLGREPLQVSGVWFVGLGGSPPGILENQVYFEGNPYANAEECDLSIQNNLLPQLTPSKYILVTHFPPYDIGYLNSKGNIVSAGNAKLQEVIFEKSPNIILYVYGHLHTQYNNDNFGGVNALNPGSVIFGQYALVTLTLGESWEVKEISLKSL